jgi:hypothetical protein
VLGVISTRADRVPDPYGAERLRALDLVAGDVATLISRAEEVAARTNILTRLENDRREALAMYDLARLAGIGADPEGDLEAGAALIADAFDHDSVAIWTLDSARGRLLRRAARGYGEILPSDIPLGTDDLVDRAMSGQESRTVRRPARGAWRSFAASSFIVSPIVVAGESAGLLIVGSHRDYEHFDFTLTMTVADILSSLVRRELAAESARRSIAEHELIVERMERNFADEMGRVIYVLDACQRLLGKDRDLPRDLARAARDARQVLGRIGPRIHTSEIAAIEIASLGTDLPAALGDGRGPSSEEAHDPVSASTEAQRVTSAA